MGKRSLPVLPVGSVEFETLPPRTHTGKLRLPMALAFFIN
jgi:hypothetical protein